MRKGWAQFVACMALPRWRWVMAVAALSDAVSFGLEFFGFGLGMILQVGVDLLTAVAMIALLGFRWTLAIPLVMEAIPVLAVFPTWTLAVAAYAALESAPDAAGKDLPIKS